MEHRRWQTARADDVRVKVRAPEREAPRVRRRERSPSWSCRQGRRAPGRAATGTEREPICRSPDRGWQAVRESVHSFRKIFLFDGQCIGGEPWGVCTRSFGENQKVTLVFCDHKLEERSLDIS